MLKQGLPGNEGKLSIIIEEILNRRIELRLDGEPEFVRSNFVNGIKRLPIAIQGLARQ